MEREREGEKEGGMGREMDIVTNIFLFPAAAAAAASAPFCPNDGKTMIFTHLPAPFSFLCSNHYAGSELSVG